MALLIEFPLVKLLHIRSLVLDAAPIFFFGWFQYHKRDSNVDVHLYFIETNLSKKHVLFHET